MRSSATQAIKRFLARRNAVVLTYHCVQRPELPFPVWHHMEERAFEEQIAWIARSFHCVKASQLVADLDRGRLVPNTVAITLDDGFANTLHVVLPILERHRVPATIFLAAGFMDQDRLMWPEHMVLILAATHRTEIEFRGQRWPIDSVAGKVAAYRALVPACKQSNAAELAGFLQELEQAAGVEAHALRDHPLWDPYRLMTWAEVGALASSPLIEFGAHTVNHAMLSQLDDEQARWEIAASRRMIEERTGPVTLFAYPYGGSLDYGERHQHMAREAGFSAAFSAQAGTVLPDSERFNLARVGVGGQGTLAELGHTLNGGIAFATGKPRWR